MAALPRVAAQSAAAAHRPNQDEDLKEIDQTVQHAAQKQ